MERFNTHGIRYAVRISYDKKAKVSYYSSLAQLSAVLEMPKDEMTKNFAIDGFFICRKSDGRRYMVKKEIKNNENTYIENTIIDTKKELLIYISENLYRYFKIEKYSNDASIKRTEKFCKWLVNFNSNDDKNYWIEIFPSSIKYYNKEAVEREIYNGLCDYFEIMQIFNKKDSEKFAKKIISYLY